MSRRAVMLLVAAALGVGAGVLAEVAHLWRGVERSSIDTRFDVRGTQDPPADVVFVGIDKKTLGDEEWPISRDHYARAIRQLNKAGARTIVLDVQITEPSEDEKADNAIFEAVRDSPRPVVMSTTEVARDGSTAVLGGGESLKASRAIPASSNFAPEGDGVARRFADSVDKLRTVMVVGASQHLDRRVATPGAGRAWVDFPGPRGSIRQLSMADVEAGTFPAASVRDKLVIIGATGGVADTLGDVQTTPVGRMPGPEIQAAALATALAGFPLRHAPDWALWLAIAVLACVAPLVTWRFGSLLGFVTGVLACGLYLVVAQVAFNNGRILTLVAPIVAGLAGTLATVVLVHSARPAWLDRFLDRLSPSRGGNQRTRRLRALLLLTAAVSVAAITLTLEATNVLRRLDLSTVDARFSIRGNQGPPPDVVLVAIDDVTFDQLDEQWPFDRRYHARVVRNLKKAGARAIGFDVQFTEPSDDPEEDLALVRGLRYAGNVVLSTTEIGPNQTTGVLGGGEYLKESRGIPASTNFEEDADSRLRRMRFSEAGVPSFPIATARVAEGKQPKLPQGNSAWINFYGGTRTVRQISYGNVYNNTFPAAAVRGKVVVVGPVAPSLQDLHRTATSGNALMPGGELQAEAIQTVLDDFPLRSAPGWLNALIILVLATLAPLIALRARMEFAIGAGVLAVAGFLVAAQLAFNDGTILLVVYPIVAGIAALLATGAIHGVTVAFEREQARDAFARFVPEAVVDQVLADAEGIRLGGVRREGTVMFSDLRGFTSFSESLEPERVIEALNRYLTEMSEAILDHGGTLVAYMGDGIMAVFGAPLIQEDHADRALEAAREMLERLEGFNQWLRDQELHEGFKMGIGLNSGPVMSGNVGSERRLEYTALGDTTNTAARLEGMTKGTPHQLYVADATKQLLTRPASDLVAVGEASVRGRKAKVLLWSLDDSEDTSDEPEPAKPERVEA